MTKMHPQARDLVAAMRDADSIPECCDLCGNVLSDNVYSVFATVCKSCTDDAETPAPKYYEPAAGFIL